MRFHVLSFSLIRHVRFVLLCVIVPQAMSIRRKRAPTPIHPHSWEEAPSARPWDGKRQRHSPEEEAQAARDYIDHMLRCHLLNGLTAKDMLIACHFAARAGAADPVGEWAMRPGQATGNYHKKFDRVVANNYPDAKAETVDISVVWHSKKGGRINKTMPMTPVHEALDAELRDQNLSLLDVASSSSFGEWEAAYASHPGTLAAKAEGTVALPAALYLDGVRYTRTVGPGRQDSVLVITAYNLLTMKRHLIGVVRKAFVCRCGCRGWCTFWPIFRFIAHCMENACDGTRASHQYDGAPWPPESVFSERFKARPRLRSRFVLVQIKGDWSEFSNTLGFPGCRSIFAPCIFCPCFADQLYIFEGASLKSVRGFTNENWSAP